MPKSCMDCPFRGFDRAGGRGNLCTINESIALHAVLDGVDVKFVRMGDCPLIEIHTPHGRLIDADALKQRKKHSNEFAENVVSVAEIDWMPTIIEEER